MSEAKHTPGPWVVVDDKTTDDSFYKNWRTVYQEKPFNKYGGRHIIIGQKDVWLSNGEVRYGTVITKADADLIAAAPEMLDELEKQRNKHCFASSGVGNCDTCRDKQNCSLLRVINKAKGVQG